MRISDWSSDVCSSDFRFEGLQLAANILRPSAIAPAVRASGLRATATLDGEFALPTVDYQANANSLAVNDIVVERLSLAGKARVDADQIIIPVAGRAARIRGLDTVAGGTLTAVRLDGDLAYADGRIPRDRTTVSWGKRLSVSFILGGRR